MAFVHGKGAKFLLDTSGTLDDISTYLTDISFPETVETADVTTLGDSSKDYIVGLKDATISLSGKWDATWDQLIDSTLGQAASLTFNYGPSGNATSPADVKYSGECFVTNYSVSSGIGDAVSFSLDLQVTGGVTRGVFS
jgi:hypothetical protein|tara:strand:- start:191 stop:607 length:417 start_codon:yes stop_codon:yes gene_type:complete